MTRRRSASGSVPSNRHHELERLRDVIDLSVGELIRQRQQAGNGRALLRCLRLALRREQVLDAHLESCGKALKQGRGRIKTPALKPTDGAVGGSGSFGEFELRQAAAHANAAQVCAENPAVSLVGRPWFARHEPTSGHLGTPLPGRAYTQIKSLTCSALRSENWGSSLEGSMRVVVVVVSLLLGSCATLQQMSMTPDERAAHAVEACEESDAKVHDLGTGSAADIARHSPHYFAQKPFLGAGEDGRANSVDISYDNQRRVNARRMGAIQRARLGGELRIKPVSESTVEFIPTEEPTPMRLRVWRFEKGGFFALFSPGTCPHVKAQDSCEDGKLVSRPYVDGVIECIGGSSTDDGRYALSLNSTWSSATKPTVLAAGEVRNVDGPSRGAQAAASIRSADGSAVLWEGSVVVNDFSDPTPEEVLAVAGAVVMERPLAEGYTALADYQLTEQFNEEITKRRAAGAAKATKAIQDSSAFAGYLMYLALGANVPGDAEVLAELRPRMESVLGEAVQEANEKALACGAQAIITTRDAGAPPLAGEKPFEEAFGSLIASGGLRDERLVAAFSKLFPDSAHLRAYNDQLEEQERLAQAERDRKAAQAAQDELWNPLQEVADQIATINWKAHFAASMMPRMSPSSQAQTKMAIGRMRAHIAALTQDSYCPAKRAFISEISAAEFTRRAAEHCKNDPPVDSGEGGEEVTLTSQCKEAYATTCR